MPADRATGPEALYFQASRSEWSQERVFGECGPMQAYRKNSPRDDRQRRPAGIH